MDFLRSLFGKSVDAHPAEVKRQVYVYTADEILDYIKDNLWFANYDFPKDDIYLALAGKAAMGFTDLKSAILEDVEFTSRITGIDIRKITFYIDDSYDFYAMLQIEMIDVKLDAFSPVPI